MTAPATTATPPTKRTGADSAADGVLRALAATASRAALTAAVAVPCGRHRAAPGEPCWRIERGMPGAGESVGACGARLRAAGLDGTRTATARPSRRPRRTAALDHVSSGN